MDEEKKRKFEGIINRMAAILEEYPADERKCIIAGAVTRAYKTEATGTMLHDLTEGFTNIIEKKIMGDDYSKTKAKAEELAQICEGYTYEDCKTCRQLWCDNRGRYYGAMAMAEWKQEEFRRKLLNFFADNITHDCERIGPNGPEKGMVINIPTYTDLINKCSEALGFDLMPILPRKNASE